MVKIYYKGDPWIKHLLFREVNNTIINKFAIVFTKNILKQLQKELDDKIFFSILHSQVKSSIEHLISP